MPCLRRCVTLSLGSVGAIFFALSPLTVEGAAIVTNGTFEDDLDGWEIRGAIAGSSGIAVVTDENATVSLLFQPVPASTGIFTVEFDFRNALSENVPAGRVADTFFATLYFTDNASTLDIPAGRYERALSLFDLDANGAFNLSGTIGPSSKGAEWSLFRFSFNNTHAFMVPAFELRDLNFVNDDSAVALDNVFVIPEPDGFSLALISGGTFIGLVRHRKPVELTAQLKA